MKILIATDGSVFSSRAVAKAGEFIATQHEPEVQVITAYEVPAPVMTEPFVPMPVYSQEIVDELRLKAEQIASNAAHGLALDFPQASITSVAVMGEPGAAVVSAAKDWNADVIVIGSHGHGFLGRMVLGSVSDFVVHNAPCTVMVVRSPSNSNGHKWSPKQAIPFGSETRRTVV
jgi:nucleotide-binding universal stress UspA family protein